MKDKSEALAGRHSNGGSVVMISDEAFKRIHARLQKPFVKRVAKSAMLAAAPALTAPPSAQAEPRECNDNDSPWLICKPCSAIVACDCRSTNECDYARAALAQRQQVPDDAGPAGEFGKHFGCSGPIDLTTAPSAQAEPNADLRADFERECADTDKLLTALGLSPEHCRTDGGSLKLGMILEALEARDRLIRREAAQAEPVVPLTDEHISALYMSGWGAYCSRKSFIAIFREAERVHGIGKQEGA